MERTSALTHLVSSLEHLASPHNTRTGGLNDWSIRRRDYARTHPWMVKGLDVLADPRVSTALHVGRVVAAASLFTPIPRRARLIANTYLTVSSAVLYPLNQVGTDGSDQVSFLAQTAAIVARAGDGRNPAVVDAGLWCVALQSTLSYAVSGWVKVMSHTWRSGAALPGVMRTMTYGDRRTYELLKRYPRASRAVGVTVLALECLFPLVFVGRGRLAPPIVASAALFHLANARVMGLGRFLTAFVAMHPAVLYAARPQRMIDQHGVEIERRIDVVPKIAGTLTAAFFSAALAVREQRAARISRGRGDELTLRTTAGNVLAYRRTGTGRPGTPLIIFENGLCASPEHWQHYVRVLSGDHEIVTYDRAGYGMSTRVDSGPYTLESSVDDLVDLVHEVAGDRPVILAGHSLGGHFAVRAAHRLGDRVAALALLDPSHPEQLQRSPSQAMGARHLALRLRTYEVSMRLGLGMVLMRPRWIDRLPAEVHETVLDQLRDPRVWSTGAREWDAVHTEFGDFDGKVTPIEVPVLVVTADETATREDVQKQMHDEMAASATGEEARNANYVGGDISGGATTAWQLAMRPAARWDPYRTPVPGLYLCSASTPPGQAVHGMCGVHAAGRALRDVFGRTTPPLTLVADAYRQPISSTDIR